MNFQNTFRGTIVLLATVSSIYGDELLIRTPSGHTISMDVQSEDSFVEVIRQVEEQITREENEESNLDLANLDNTEEDLSSHDSNAQFFLDYSFTTPIYIRSATRPRNYASIVTPKEKEDIKYIVKTLAKGSWTELLKQKSSLKKAGDRVDHVHPLRFISYIFSDTELNGCLHAIRDRSKVWKEFIEGLSKSFDEESAIGNVTKEFVQDFANGLKIDAKPLFGPAANRQWSTFISIIMEKIPRSGNPDRYDI